MVLYGHRRLSMSPSEVHQSDATLIFVSLDPVLLTFGVQVHMFGDC
jgi:hypothetical protein